MIRLLRQWTWPTAMLLAIVFACPLLSCSDDDGTQPLPVEDSMIEEMPLLYDGSYNDALGIFHITDLRSEWIVSDADSIDLYAAMEDYETRNLIIFHPAGATDRPVVFFVHGGGWTDGYMEWYKFVAESFTEVKGWITVVVNYRLTSDQVFPVSVCPTRDSPAPSGDLKAAWYPDNSRDCADALAWVIDNIASYGGDSDAIFLFGHSAGGHLVSLLATHPDFDSLRRSIRGVISMSGGYQLNELSLVAFASVLDQTFGTHSNDGVLAEASPATYVQVGIELPPFLVMHCEDEILSLDAQAIAFSERLDSYGFEVETEYLGGYGHISEMQAIESVAEEPTARIIRFIEEHLDPS